MRCAAIAWAKYDHYDDDDGGDDDGDGADDNDDGGGGEYGYECTGSESIPGDSIQMHKKFHCVMLCKLGFFHRNASS